MCQLEVVPRGPALGRGEPPEGEGRLRAVPLVEGTHQSRRLAGAESQEEGPSDAVARLDYVRVRSECGPGRDEVVELAQRTGRSQAWQMKARMMVLTCRCSGESDS